MLYRFLYNVAFFLFNAKLYILAYVFFRITILNTKTKELSVIGIVYIYYHYEQYEKAILFLSKILCNFETDDILFQLAYCHQKNGELEKSIEIYENLINKQILRNEKIDISIIINIIDIYTITKNFIKVNKIINHFSENFENDSALFFNIGHAFYDQGQYNEAMKYYKKSLHLKIEDTAGVYHSLGNVFYRLGDYKKSMAYYKNALQESKDISMKAMSYFSIGCLYNIMGEKDKAKEMLLLAEKAGSKKARIALQEID